MSTGNDRTGSSIAPSPSRLERLLGFLESDPHNLKLIGDAAAAAYDERRHEQVSELLNRYEQRASLPGPLANLKGRLALDESRYSDAAHIFDELRRMEGDSPGLRFNLAWALAMQEKFAEALPLLDDESLQISPRAPSLKIQVMHHLALYDEALQTGEELAARFPQDEALMGALSTLALDAGNRELALGYASNAGRNSEAEAALGMLALDEHDAVQSLRMFDRVLTADPSSPRAWVGRGLSLLAAGDAKAAVGAIDRGATLFGTHVGSWVASGWAHFLTGDLGGARKSFERASEVNPKFSECHGGLAVLAISEGNIADAEREAEIALRLDKASFGGALARMLLAARAGRPDVANRIREVAFSTPIGPSGRTIAQEIAKLGIGIPRN